MDDSPVKCRSIAFDQVLAFELIEDSNDGGWTEIGFFGDGAARDFTKVSDTCEHHKLRQRQPNLAIDPTRLNINGSGDPTN